MSLRPHTTHSFFLHRFLSRWIDAQITSPTSVRHPHRSRFLLHALPSGVLDTIQNPYHAAASFKRLYRKRARRGSCAAPRLFHRRAPDTALTFIVPNPACMVGRAVPCRLWVNASRHNRPISARFRSRVLWCSAGRRCLFIARSKSDCKVSSKRTRSVLEVSAAFKRTHRLAG